MKMSDMRGKTVCFTGHREIPFLKSSAIKKRLRKTLEDLIERGFAILEQVEHWVLIHLQLKLYWN